MSTLIKNCGLKTPEAVHEAARSGAHFIGFVHHQASPRHLELEEMAALSEKAPPQLKQVVVLVDPSDALIGDILNHFRPHFWQLHRVAKPERVHRIVTDTAIPAIVGVNIGFERDVEAAKLVEPVAAHMLFDAYDPRHEGGTGKPFDWSLLKHITPKKPWFLAGGLTPENVEEALRVTGAPMVDVSSGIEDSPGIKSLEKIAAFNEAVLRHG